MFVQGARGSDRSEGGLGLGLSLVRTLTTLHGGTVSAHSDGPGQGSEFTVRLPASAPRPDAPRPEQRHASPGRRHPRASAFSSSTTTVDGAEMISASWWAPDTTCRWPTIRLTRCRCRTLFRPQVAILDIGLPVMDGYALGRELRARLEGRSSP